MDGSRKTSKGKGLQDADLSSYDYDYEEDPPISSQNDEYEDKDEDEQPLLPFNVEAYRSFCNSLPEVVKNGSFGQWGSLYAETVGGVVRIKVTGKNDPRCLSGFVIYKSENFATIMTTNNRFHAKDLMVYNYHLKKLKVKRIYHARNMDFSLMQVEGEIDCLHSLKFDMGDISFGQKMFAISCPTHESFVGRNDVQSDEEIFNFINTVLFCMSRGYANHPSYVGIHRINSSGSFINFYARGIYYGSFGSPLFNDKGKVVGMVLCANDASMSMVTDWALSLKSIVSWIESEFSNDDRDLKALAEGFIQAIHGEGA